MKRKLIIFIIIISGLFIYSNYKMSTKNPDILKPLIDEIETNIINRDRRKAKISQSDIAWQLDHALKVINRVSDTLIASNPEAYSSNFNAGRVFTLTGGYIPRGVAKSPDVVKPPEIILTEDLKAQIQEARKNIAKMKDLSNSANFTHFAFGQMDKSQTIRFLEVHTKHHLKIVRDILK